MKKILLSTLLIAILVITKAQIPANYYDAAQGKTGAALKTALYGIIKGHTVISYDALINAYKTTDQRVDGKIWDMYSNCTYTIGTKQCGSYKVECDCYNREHSFPQSWFAKSSPMVSDLFHVYPTDGKVNGMRNNYPFGTVASPSYILQEMDPNLDQAVFRDTQVQFLNQFDEYKGDFARTYFYMATRYENLIASWKSNGNADEVLNGTQYPCYDQWFINLLSIWNTADPVSQKKLTGIMPSMRFSITATLILIIQSMQTLYGLQM